VGPFTSAALSDRAGDILTVIRSCRSGLRMGIDRDLDGHFDGD
jgi:hypothetical protein